MPEARTAFLASAVLFAAVMLASSDGLLLKLHRDLVGDGGPNTLFYKYLFSCLFGLPLPMYLQGGAKGMVGGINNAGGYMWAAVVANTISSVTGSLALVFGEAAVVALLFSLAPLWGALLGKVFLGEELRVHTIAALIISLCALLICILPEITRLDDEENVSGGTFITAVMLKQRVASMLLGCVTGLMTACEAIIYRMAPRSGVEGDAMTNVPMLAAASATAMMSGACAVYSFSFSQPSTSALSISMSNGLVTALFEIVFIITARYLTAVNIMLITQLEAVLLPVWVWAILHDAPSNVRDTVSALGLLLFTVTAHTLYSEHLREMKGENGSDQEQAALMSQKQLAAAGKGNYDDAINATGPPTAGTYHVDDTDLSAIGA